MRPAQKAELLLGAAVVVHLVVVETIFVTGGSGRNDLLTLAKLFGLNVAAVMMVQLVLVARLPWLDRRLGTAPVFLFGFVFVGAAEMAGCIMFHQLRGIGVELFADEPEVAARIERLYSEILTDEGVMWATAPRAAQPRSGRSCAASTHG